MALQPLFAIMAAGLVFVGAYTIRLATKTTDIQWYRHEECMNENLKDKQFRMLSPALGGPDGLSSKADPNRPDYKSK